MLACRHGALKCVQRVTDVVLPISLDQIHRTAPGRSGVVSAWLQALACLPALRLCAPAHVVDESMLSDPMAAMQHSTCM